MRQNGRFHRKECFRCILRVCVLQIYPSGEQPVAHDEFYLIVAREGGGQRDLRHSRVDGGGVDHIAILILYIKDIVRMVGNEREGEVLNVDRGRLHGGLVMISKRC